MSDYRARVREDYAELTLRTKRLALEIDSSPSFDELPKGEQLLLIRQLFAMEQYRNVLKERIDNFSR